MAGRKSTARILLDNMASGILLRCNDVVEGSREQIAALVAAGVADENEGAVNYARLTLLARTVTLPDNNANIERKSKEQVVSIDTEKADYT